MGPGEKGFVLEELAPQAPAGPHPTLPVWPLASGETSSPRKTGDHLMGRQAEWGFRGRHSYLTSRAAPETLDVNGP